MPKAHEIYLEHLTKAFSQEDDVFQHEAPVGGSPVSVFVYRDPRAGHDYRRHLWPVHVRPSRLVCSASRLAAQVTGANQEKTP